MKKINWFLTFIIALAVMLFVMVNKVAFTRTIIHNEAFGHPGLCPTWSPSTLTFLGTAQNPNSKVWFTGFDGIISQVFYYYFCSPNRKILKLCLHGWCKLG